MLYIFIVNQIKNLSKTEIFFYLIATCNVTEIEEDSAIAWIKRKKKQRHPAIFCSGFVVWSHGGSWSLSQLLQGRGGVHTGLFSHPLQNKE